MQKILITGGSGLVGQSLHYIKSYYCYDFIFANSSMCNLTNYQETYAFFEKTKPRFVIHLAANVGGLYKNMNHKLTMLEDNMLMNYNVLKCCHEFKVEKVVSCLSTCIFPDKTTYPINETMLHNGPPHHSNDAYAYSKRMLDIFSQMYREQYQDNFVCVIPTNIYGPHDNYHLENAHVIPALIHQCYLAKRENRDFVVRGDGSPLRQFIYSIDLAKLLMWVLEDYPKSENIILSVSESDEVSIKTVAEEIALAMDYQGHMRFDSSFANGQHKKTADNSKLMHELSQKQSKKSNSSSTMNEFRFTPFREGIQSSVKWFVENYERCRK
jgi:GDP-L-fucose synthase